MGNHDVYWSCFARKAWGHRRAFVFFCLIMSFICFKQISNKNFINVNELYSEHASTVGTLNDHVAVLQAEVDEENKAGANNGSLKHAPKPIATVPRSELSQPLVSVIICAHKSTIHAIHAVIDTVWSVLDQSYLNVEAVVVDGSKDGVISDKVKLEFAAQDNRVVIVRSEPGKFAGWNRNLGVEHSKGEFVGFLDGDDVYVKDKLTKHMAWANWFGVLNFSGTDAYDGGCRYGKNNSQWTSWNTTVPGFSSYNGGKYYTYYEKLLKLPFNGGNLLQKWDKNWLQTHNSAITSTVVMRKTFFYEVGRFDEKAKPGHEDYELWKRALTFTTHMGYMGVPLVIYDSCHSSRS